MMMDSTLLDAEQMARYLRIRDISAGMDPADDMDKAAWWVEGTLVPAFGTISQTPLALRQVAEASA